eukprot:TRINITY_DN18206_c0_g1_i5.p1 TRINITY_DN18206_c0_g1~~TRINITY_DN18206_c0_g1_i5.p1  ORF type:complete len:240 (-),score=54.08 TRINITY_DN18206_c0_g1_i5:88-807(-)
MRNGVSTGTVLDSSVTYSHNLLNITQDNGGSSNPLYMYLVYTTARNLQLDISSNTLLVLGYDLTARFYLRWNSLQDSTLSIANNFMACGAGMCPAGFDMDYDLPSITNSLVELRGNTVKEANVAILVRVVTFGGLSRTSFLITGNSAHSTTYEYGGTFGLIHLNADSQTLFHDGSVLDVSENTYTIANIPFQPISTIAMLSTCMKPLLSQQSRYTVSKNTITATGNVCLLYTSPSPRDS